MPAVKRSPSSRDTENGRNGRVDVGDDGRAHRADLRDQIEEQQERHSGANHRETGDGENHVETHVAR